MIDLDEITRQLAASAQAIQALARVVPDQQADWKPDPQTWSLKEVMDHLYLEEQVDFRQHLQEMLHDPPLAWGALRHEPQPAGATLQQALGGFLEARKDSLAWLKTLESPYWERTTPVRWGTISAASVLASWLEHDYLHLRQMIELLYAWNEQQAAPHSVEYAGGW